MSLEELKKDWDAIGESSDKNKISNEQIERILMSKYRSFFNTVLVFETFMLLTYLYFFVLTVFRFEELEIIYLEVLGIISITILALLFTLSLMKLKHNFQNRFLNHSPLIVLKKITKQKIRLQKFYLLNIVLGFFLIVLLIILNIKIYNEYDLIQSKYFWLTIIPASFIFIVLVNKWIRKSYKRVIREAEDLLQELK